MLIVNLTTIYSRLHLCSATLWSLSNQSIIADKIIVWVSTESYLADTGIHSSPKWLSKVNFNNNIEFRETPNTGPYRKIIPALNYFSSEDILVYADDDVIYGERWLESLYDCFKLNGEELIIASRVREIKYNLFGRVRSYNDFPLIVESKKMKKDFIITGVGGCMLMKKHISPEFYQQSEFLKLATLTDDIWLSFCFQKSDSELFVASEVLNEVYTIEHDSSSLSSSNTFYKVKLKYGKIYFKFKNIILGYLGFTLTNNDKSIKKVMRFLSTVRNK